MKTKSLILMAFTVAALLLLVAPAKWVSAEPIRLGLPRQMGSSLVWVADNQGFFKKRGVDIVVKEYEAGVMAVNDLAADKIDMAVSAEFVFVLQSLKNPDLRMPATICMAFDHEFVVRKDRGISQPQDLRGKRVAVTRGSSGEFFLYNYLIFNRIPSASIRIVYYTPSEIVKAMADGTVDAALSWQPYVTEMEKQMGAKVARWPAQNSQDYYFPISTKKFFLEKHSKTMEHLLAALQEAEQFIVKHPKQAQTILREKVRLDPGAFSAVQSSYNFQLQLTQDLLVLMEQEAKWAIRNNLVEKREVPNYLNFFYFQALDKVKPEGVTIVH